MTDEEREFLRKKDEQKKNRSLRKKKKAVAVNAIPTHKIVYEEFTITLTDGEVCTYQTPIVVDNANKDVMGRSLFREATPLDSEVVDKVRKEAATERTFFAGHALRITRT